jgi:hypothetical protein
MEDKQRRSNQGAVHMPTVLHRTAVDLQSEASTDSHTGASRCLHSGPGFDAEVVCAFHSAVSLRIDLHNQLY